MGTYQAPNAGTQDSTSHPLASASASIWTKSRLLDKIEGGHSDHFS